MPTAEAFLGVLPFNLKGSSPIPRRLNSESQGHFASNRFSRLFRHRESKNINTETDNVKAKADRRGVIEDETHYLQKRSTELLLESNFSLTRLLCRLEISGDKAATMASYLISFLRGNPQSSYYMETLITEVFDEYLQIQTVSMPNPRNVLRDNNLATMLIVCYLQQSCREYLVSIIQPVMKAIRPFVGNCELDPMRLPHLKDSEITTRNAYNLYCVCRSVLDAVFSAGKHAPAEMRHLCVFLRNRIEEKWGLGPTFPRNMHMIHQNIEHTRSHTDAPSLVSETKAPNKQSMDSSNSILELGDWEHNLKSTVQSDIMSDIGATLDEWLSKPESSSQILSSIRNSQLSNNRKSARNSRRTTGITFDKTASMQNVQATKHHREKIAVSKNDKSQLEARKAIEELVSSFSNSSILHDNLELGCNLVDTCTGISTADNKSCSSDSGTRASEQIHEGIGQLDIGRLSRPNGNSSKLNAAHFKNRHSSKRYSGSYFAPVETVISMLIFVRFFIPILTAPDTYGLDIELQPSNRRGLLLCAKVLAVLCNGVTFGSKEPYLSPMNNLIREYRPKLRRYLRAISSEIQYSSLLVPESEQHVSDEEFSDDDYVTIDELAMQFQAVTTGAKVGTREEQRRSRQSLYKPTYTNGQLYFATNSKDVPPVPPIPHISHIDCAKPPSLTIGRTAYNKPRQRGTPIQYENVYHQSRSTIDIPYHSQNLQRFSLHGEIIDNGIVSLQFLLCIESNIAKIEARTNKDTAKCANDNIGAELFRELKPILLYAKRLTVVTPETNALNCQPSDLQKYVNGPQLSPNQPKPSIEYQDSLGHRRTSTLPENYRYQVHEVLNNHS